VTSTEHRSDLFLPDPDPRPVRTAIISVDDHLVEPPDMFEGRLPAAMQERAPRVEETSRGHQIWRFDGSTYSQVGMNAVAGRRPETVEIEPFRFDEMRKGCWDADARVHDMDLGAIWASVNFPSQITGFCGSVFSKCSDPELGLAVTRAWNDWFHEEWASAHPDRIIPLGITWLTDPVLGAEEIRRNAERGFKAVTLPERPHRIGLPTLFEGYWDPIIEACAETDTVIALHVGSSGLYDFPPGRAPLVQLGATLFGQLSLTACAEWLWSEIPVRFPGVKIAMSEGGIGWVAMLLDRLDNIVDRSGYGQDWPGDLRPSEVMQRNFWFCTIDDPSTIDTRDRIGVDHIMVEVDYPHGDTTWPDTQQVIAEVWGHLPDDDLHRICHANAAELFRHPLPEPCCPEVPAPMAGSTRGPG
jgi:predicted TIM-barrel fold metal-dependent hydrolase